MPESNPNVNMKKNSGQNFSEKKSDAGRYRKVEVKMWSDKKFMRLSPIPPCGRGLFLYLLTGPFTGPIPGMFKAGAAAIAEDLGWTVEEFHKAFREISGEAFQEGLPEGFAEPSRKVLKTFPEGLPEGFAEPSRKVLKTFPEGLPEGFAEPSGMAKADFEARFLWLPNAIKYNPPASPNVVLKWGKEFDLLPECDLKDEALLSLKSFIDTLGKGFQEAFAKAFGKALAKVLKTFPEGLPEGFAEPSRKAYPNQDQDQDTKQEGLASQTGLEKERDIYIPSNPNTSPQELGLSLFTLGKHEQENTTVSSPPNGGANAEHVPTPCHVTGDSEHPADGSPDTGIASPSDDFYKFAENFQKRVRQEQGTKAPKVNAALISSGQKTLEQLVRIDGHAWETVQTVLLWALTDDFWQEQIRSLAKLRVKSKNGCTKFSNVLIAYEKSADKSKFGVFSAAGYRKPEISPPPYSEWFEACWKKYPNQNDKGEAWQVFRELLNQLPDNLEERIVNRSYEDDWYPRNDAGRKKFIPTMAKWLLKRGWEDAGCFPEEEDPRNPPPMPEDMYDMYGVDFAPGETAESFKRRQELLQQRAKEHGFFHFAEWVKDKWVPFEGGLVGMATPPEYDGPDGKEEWAKWIAQQ